MDIRLLCVILGFLGEEGEICALLGYFAAYSGNYLPMFRNRYPETSVGNYRYTLHNNPDSGVLFVCCVCCRVLLFVSNCV